MAGLVVDLPTGTPPGRSETRVLTGEVQVWGVVSSAAMITWADGADVLPAEEHRDVEFEREKRAFMAISPFSLAPYRGRYVTSRGGTIIDSDPDLAVLVGRVFRQYGDVPVYVTKVGQASADVRFDTPFFE